MRPIDLMTSTIEALIEAHAILRKHEMDANECVGMTYIEKIIYPAEDGIYTAFRNLMGIPKEDDRDEITDFIAKVFSWDANNKEDITDWKGAEIMTEYHDLIRSFGEYEENMEDKQNETY